MGSSFKVMGSFEPWGASLTNCNVVLVLPSVAATKMPEASQVLEVRVNGPRPIPRARLEGIKGLAVLAGDVAQHPLLDSPPREWAPP